MTAFYYLIFPGFLFIIIMGFMTAWVDRKVTARIQYRAGPPILQSFLDMFKLLGKEIIIPKGGSKFIFLVSPILAFSSTLYVGVCILLSMFGLTAPYLVSDVFVITYLLAIPSLFIIMGALASRNPLASVGAARETKLFIAYELPYILCITAIIVKLKSGGWGLQLGEFVKAQSAVPFSSYASGIIALIVLILCMHAKLTLTPFDIPEAETELMDGTFIEYSGYPLALFYITKMMLFFILPVYVILLTWGKPVTTDISILWFALKYLGIVVVMILIKNTNPRLRIDQAVRFFWFYLSVPALASLILAILGY